MVLAAAAHAQTWTLTTADFRTQHVELRSIDDQSMHIIAGGGQEQVISLDDVLQVQSGSAAAGKSEPARFMLHLTGGGRLAGEPVAVRDERLQWKNAILGELTVPLRRIAAIAPPQTAPALPDQRRIEDVATLSNGDVVRGIVTDLNAQTLTVKTPAGDEAPVPLENVVSVIFASTGPAPEASGRAFGVRLSDGSSVRAEKLLLKDAQLTLTLGGYDAAPRTLDLAAVTSLEQINGPVSWLSSRTPSESVHIPFLDTAWPARMDQTVRGEPIRFEDRTFARGIGVHSLSRLTFALEGAYEAFRTQYAIDGDLPYADVTVRIKLDERVAHEWKNFKAGVLSPVVLLDLKGARALTLEVDYGQGYDVQDRFNWIEPALLRTAPKPATQAAE